ncbi:MAG TPA: cyclic nucleotide-binding domain-containing protein [Thermoanaerobaculia bacterium]|nr:cyclic nucleotide-binding domain-containing protein [Thermoanaerobaculia bacterium]HUM30380.1 cyclic nucleotide-binding domain-containing protein [Thermoanaerobaculia bacterium]HXK68609.1 cyclic nucleotide-binding domain-containing protein [Thermoanaerobaculia bacterium]
MTKVKVVTGSDRNFYEKLLVKFPIGATIFQEGELGTTMYIIQRGKVEIRKSIGGAEQILSILEKGDFFGEMSILEGAPRSASAHAVDEVEVLEIDEATFDQMLRTNQEIAVRMLRKLSRKLRQTTELLEQLAGRTLSMEAPKPTRPSGPVDSRYKLVSEDDPEIIYQIQQEGDTIIGRKDPVTGIFPDIDLGKLDTHRSVSRRHAIIVMKDGKPCLKEEVGTMNGTYLNGEQITKGELHPMKPGDTIQIAAVKLRLDVA